LAEAAATDRPEEAMPGLILVLVVEGRDGLLRGVLQAVPPTNVLADGMEAGVPVLAAVIGAARSPRSGLSRSLRSPAESGSVPP
jgi:hypothetical protein